MLSWHIPALAKQVHCRHVPLLFRSSHWGFFVAGSGCAVPWRRSGSCAVWSLGLGQVQGWGMSGFNALQGLAMDGILELEVDFLLRSSSSDPVPPPPRPRHTHTQRPPLPNPNPQLGPNSYLLQPPLQPITYPPFGFQVLNCIICGYTLCTNPLCSP